MLTVFLCINQLGSRLFRKKLRMFQWWSDYLVLLLNRRVQLGDKCFVKGIRSAIDDSGYVRRSIEFLVHPVLVDVDALLSTCRLEERLCQSYVHSS
jgi:hypothetical protein